MNSYLISDPFLPQAPCTFPLCTANHSWIMRVERRSLWSDESLSSLSKNGFPCRGEKEFSRTPAKLLPTLLLRFCIIQWVPKEFPAPAGTQWEEATPGALQWEYPQGAEYLWTAVDALQISLLSKPLQLFLQCLNAQLSLSPCLTFEHFPTLHALLTWPSVWQHSWSPTI